MNITDRTPSLDENDPDYETWDERAEVNSAYVRDLIAWREPGYAAALEDAAAGIVL